MEYPLENERILVFAPAFFNYEKAIKNKLKQFGAHVDFYDERPSNSTLGKAVVRLYKKAAKTLINKHYEKIKVELKGKEYDSIIFFQAEATPRWFIEFVKEKFTNSHKILYLWDSVADKPDNISNIDLYDAIFTFDPLDAKKFGIKFRPLFYIDEYLVESYNDISNFKYDFSFIGTVRKDRYSILQELKKDADNKGQKYFVFYYLQSKLIYFYLKYIKHDFENSNIKDFSFASLTHKKIQEIISNSKVVVDIQKEHQIGLTIRTIELLAAKKKFVTTNKEIIKYNFFNESSIAILEREKPTINSNFLSSSMLLINHQIFEQYSIGYFLLEILGIMPSGNYYSEF